MAKALSTQAKVLREMLSSDRKAGADTNRGFMNKIHNANQAQANALKEKLFSDEKARTEATRQFMGEIRKTNKEHRKTVREMLAEIASDLLQADQMWGKIGKKKIAPNATAKEVVEEVEGKPEVEAAPSISKIERILEIVTRHPEGIKLVDIGNELGINWRSLIGDIKSLVDEDKVEKIDSMYYPK